MKTSTRITLGVLVLCIVLIVVWFAKPRPVSDTSEIASQIDAATTSANRHSVGGIMSVVSSTYLDSNNFTPDNLRLMLSQGFQKFPGAEISMTQPLINVSGDTATSVSTMTITDQDQGNHVIYPPRDIHLQWKREKGVKNFIFPAPVWRITAADYGSFGEGF